MDETSEHGDGASRRLSEQDVAGMSSVELLRHITQDVAELAKKQIALARAEARADLRAEAGAAGSMAVAGVGALIAVTLLLVAGVLALATVLPGWAAGLIVAGFVACLSAVAALIGWRNRVRQPLERTREVVREETARLKARRAARHARP